jgi:hypothetical protein
MTEIATVVGGAPPALIGLVAAAALAAFVVQSRAHGRQLERRLATELGPPTVWPPPPVVETVPAPVGAARADGPRRRDAELRITLEELLERPRTHEPASNVIELSRWGAADTCGRAHCGIPEHTETRSRPRS